MSGRAGGTLAEYKINGGGGLALKVEEWGNPEGQPILFIHGWSQSHLCWHQAVPGSKASKVSYGGF